MRHVAPAGAPIRPRDLARWVCTGLGIRTHAARLQSDLAERHGMAGAALVSTGRAALVVILRAMHAVAPDRREVVLPSYTCFSVAASIVKAGLTPRVADVDESTIDFDRASLVAQVGPATLAIVATNLFGYPSDFTSLASVARLHGAFVIDDAAQALGAFDSERPVGGRGDAGLLSFDKGKNVSAIAGGVVLYGPHLAEVVERETSALPRAAAAEEAAIVAKALVYSALLHPRMYWIPNAMPWLGLGITRYATDYPLKRCSAAAASLASTMIRREAEFATARRRNAYELISALEGVPGVSIPRERPGTRGAFLRLPILLPTPVVRDAVLVALNEAGFGATGSYPAAIVDVPELRSVLPPGEAGGGRAVASRIATLPTHPYVTARDIARMADLVRHTVFASARVGHGREAAALS